jgi:hypothetical protein
VITFGVKQIIYGDEENLKYKNLTEMPMKSKK